LTHCYQCHALYRDVHLPCPICGHQIPRDHPIEGSTDTLPRYTVPGAVPTSFYFLLELMRTETERPPVVQLTRGGSIRLVIVLMFWTAFEILMERFFAAAFADDVD